MGVCPGRSLFLPYPSFSFIPFLSASSIVSYPLLYPTFCPFYLVSFLSVTTRHPRRRHLPVAPFPFVEDDCWDTVPGIGSLLTFGLLSGMHSTLSFRLTCAHNSSRHRPSDPPISMEEQCDIMTHPPLLPTPSPSASFLINPPIRRGHFCQFLPSF